MPIREFYCPQCQKVLERILNPSDDADGQYHFCGTRLQKQTSVSSFRIEGYSARNGYSSPGSNG